jgi:glutamate synthase domain-containing protein 3
VCEGAGKYAFEYMTGGLGMVLGQLGRVVGSGMTGGELFLLDDGTLERKLHSDARIVPWDAESEARARALLERHVAETGSVTAQSVAAQLSAKLRRVVPAA